MTYKVPFVDVPKHFRSLREPILATVEEVLSRGNLILRGELREFEQQFAAFIGTKYAVGVNSGTDALHLSLRAFGFEEGDEVITVSHTCIATVAAIVNAGAKPILVDVADDFNMDVDCVEDAITERTRTIVPVHLNGRSCNMEKLLAIAEKHDLTVVEDAAQAVGAMFAGRRVGSFGRVGCFSLYPFKMLGAFGDAGIVVTNDSSIAKTVSRLRDYGEDRETGDILHFGFNARLDNLQAALLSLKLERLPEYIERRRTIASHYTQALSGLSFLRVPQIVNGNYFDVFLNYTVRTPFRDELVEHLKQGGVEPLVPLSLVKPIHNHSALGLGHFSLPRTERIAREFLYLPIYPELDDAQVEYVIDRIRSFSHGQFPVPELEVAAKS